MEPESEEAKRANTLLNEKYGLLKRIIEPVVAHWHGRAVVVEIQVHSSLHDD